MSKLPKIVFTDIDGVWTDGGMYYDNLENEFKKFNTSDSAGVLYCKILKIPVVILTGENTHIVERRSKKLKVDYLFQGVHNKLKVATELCDKLGIALADAAYIGDDLIDIPLLDKVGLSACPANAPDYIKNRVHFCTAARGGDGAFREFLEHILHSNKLFDQVVAQLIAQYEATA